MVVALTCPLWAQAPPAPTLTEADALKLAVAELTVENSALRLEAARRDAEQLLRSLQREGYVLTKERGADGVARWVYRPVPAPERDQPKE